MNDQRTYGSSQVLFNDNDVAARDGLKNFENLKALERNNPGHSFFSWSQESRPGAVGFDFWLSCPEPRNFIDFNNNLMKVIGKYFVFDEQYRVVSSLPYHQGTISFGIGYHKKEENHFNRQLLELADFWNSMQALTSGLMPFMVDYGYSEQAEFTVLRIPLPTGKIIYYGQPKMLGKGRKDISYKDLEKGFAAELLDYQGLKIFVGNFTEKPEDKFFVAVPKAVFTQEFGDEFSQRVSFNFLRGYLITALDKLNKKNL